VCLFDFRLNGTNLTMAGIDPSELHRLVRFQFIQENKGRVSVSIFVCLLCDEANLIQTFVVLSIFLFWKVCSKDTFCLTVVLRVFY
jgi:hypothetical protein